MHCIYIIQNKLNNKIYVGQSINYKKRWSDHKRNSRNLWLGKNIPTDSCIQVIHRAMAKYGIENFDLQVIEEWNNQEDIDEAECFWISFLQSRNPQFGYNSIPGGRRGVGCGIDHPNYGKPAHNRLFTNGEEKTICSRYINEKLTITKLAELYNCEQSTIHKMLQRNNTKILGNKVFSKGRHHSIATEFKKGQEAHNKRFTIEQELTICKEYKDDKLTCPQIAKKYNCNKSIIQKLLRRYNIHIRSKAKLTDMDKVQIREEFLNNSSLKLAAKYGVNKSTILRICK